mmetsp:Transcript_21233/g.32059  ORF Transcript_21233/g.32059 Transcript_21233/m.32059 type:complete len:242 (+) Transcript_21233:993-1718(+)
MKGFIFDEHPVRSIQITRNRKTVDRLRIVVGQQSKKAVLKAIKGMDTDLLTDSLVEPTPVHMDANQTRMSDGAKIKYRAEMDAYEKKKEKAEAEMHQVYSLILGQCTDAMVSRLQEMSKFDDHDTENDPVGLLNLISNVSLSFNTLVEPIMATWLAKWEFARLKQGEKESNQDYFQRFISMHDMNISVEVNSDCDEAILTTMAKEYDKDKDLLDEGTKKKYMEEGHSRLLAKQFALGSDPR